MGNLLLNARYLLAPVLIIVAGGVLIGGMVTEDRCNLTICGFTC